MIDELAKYLKKHTLIFIKESARCTVSFLHKNLIGVLYERILKKPNHSVIVQGLAGRACGYDVDDLMIVYSNVESVEKYNKMVSWKFINRDGFENLKKKKTHLHHSTYTNTDEEVSVIENTRETNNITMKECRTFEEVKDYFDTLPKHNFGGKGRGPRKPKSNKVDHRGFMKASIRGETKVYTLIEIDNEKKWGMDKNGYNLRVHPCYRDINDISTLVYAVVHKI